MKVQSFSDDLNHFMLNQYPSMDTVLTKLYIQAFGDKFTLFSVDPLCHEVNFKGIYNFNLLLNNPPMRS